MKKTKILVPAIAVLALGLAATTTATVAWFSAASTAQLVDKSGSAEISVQSSVYSAGSYWMKATATLSPTTVDYTDKNGNCWVIVNGYLRTAEARGSKYSTLTIAVNFYSNEACTNLCSASELAEIGSVYSGLTVTIDPNANTRLTTTNPASNFGTAFSGKLDASSTVTFAISTTGVATAESNTHYVSVNGDGASEVATSHSDGESAPAEYTTAGGIALSIGTPTQRA